MRDSLRAWTCTYIYLVYLWSEGVIWVLSDLMDINDFLASSHRVGILPCKHLAVWHVQRGISTLGVRRASMYQVSGACVAYHIFKSSAVYVSQFFFLQGSLSKTKSRAQRSSIALTWYSNDTKMGRELASSDELPADMPAS